MTPGGWIVMILSVGTVTGLLVWSIFKVLTTPGETGHVHGFEVQTPDEKAEYEAAKHRQANRRKQTDVPFPEDDSKGRDEPG